MVVLVLIAFTGCEKDLYEDSIQDSSRKIIVKKISLNNIDKKTSSKIATEISKFKNIRSESTSQGRLEYDSSLDIFIDTENGRLREINGKEFYTFPMFKENETDLQNVLFEIKSDGSLESYFIKYDVTPEQFNELSNADILNLDSEYQKIMSADGTTEYICVDLYSVETVYNEFELNEGNGNPSSSSSEPTYVGSFCNWVEGGGGGSADGGGVGGNTSGSHSGGGDSNSSGSLYTGPVSLSPDLLLMKDFIRDFLEEDQEELFTKLTQKEQSNIFVYLLENDFTPVSKQFIKDCLDKINEDPNDDFKSITPFLIEKKIDDSELDPCTRAILNKLKQNHNIAKVISRFDSPETPFELNFTLVPNLMDSDGNSLYGQNVPSQTGYTNTIMLNSNFYNNNGATHLGKASTILHEIIHALIASVIQNAENSNNTDSTDFPEIWNAYVNIKTGGITPEDHEFMGANYVNIIQNALSEYQPGLDAEIYNDLAWQGIWVFGDGPQFNNLLSGTKKASIYNRKKTEMNKSLAYGMTPSSNNPCLP